MHSKFSRASLDFKVEANHFKKLVILHSNGYVRASSFIERRENYKILTAADMDFHFSPPAFPTFNHHMQWHNQFLIPKIYQTELEKTLKNYAKDIAFLQLRQPSHGDFLFWRSFWTPHCSFSKTQIKGNQQIQLQQVEEIPTQLRNRRGCIQEHKKGTGRPLWFVGVFLGLFVFIGHSLVTLFCLDCSLSLPNLSEKNNMIHNYTIPLTTVSTIKCDITP